MSEDSRFFIVLAVGIVLTLGIFVVGCGKVLDSEIKRECVWQNNGDPQASRACYEEMS